MIDFDIPKQKSSIIKVIGVGGGGGNAVNHMFGQKIENVDFIICNTDAQALENSAIPNRIQLGPHLTQGLGAGANPSIGRQATEESLEEIKRILEVNTKMAFVCAGMGGGTGTGGAPIIAKICQDLGILTVGIVTTPFSFEGPRRRGQAESGIKELEPHVDTLLVISNDKLRMQHKNLKMREAFGKADDVLSTAAKCITDIINSNGQINVDFADVCTVMRKGGVAILGSAVAEGDARAQTAIEDAINSPLLNDSDISGAKWILLNINTSEGEFECGTDEFELINDFVREKAGDETDVIVGMGIDETLGKGLSVTLIATGFEHKNPFDKDAIKKVADKDKVLFTLDMQEKPQPVAKPIASATPAAEPQVTVQAAPEQPETAPQPVQAAVQQTESDSLVPRLVENQAPSQETDSPAQQRQPEPVSEQAPEVVHFTLDAEPQQQAAAAQPSENNASVPSPTPTPQVHVQEQQPTQAPELEFGYSEKETTATNEQPETTQVPGFLNKPANIYAPQPAKPQHAFVQQPKPAQPQPQSATQQPAVQTPSASQQQPQPVQQRPTMNTIPNLQQEEEEMQIVYKDTPQPVTTPAQPVGAALGGDQDLSEEEMKKRKAEERIQKLRNLSYNVQSGDPNGDFDAVPAYVRRNLEMLGGAESSTAENYYSKYTVNKDEKEGTNISSLNAFLEGKKPD
ncbi:cell division protein FtsZ [Arachidicoccus terrestris]|uniref:cell division protein FtsZ n=1 Tax=Arachidicoccus terrestris TaxID=2875539 RepID=UPI001CC71B9B|nr:cell division protein FtsZ [Arachidicoccus terrestris]UAY53949.1 cell division protein FtsZ [Arachidicoccus terrestris]